MRGGGRRRSILIVGSVLVRNEDVFVERAIRNVAAFCDRIHVVDHLSTDGTWTIIRELRRDFDHLDIRRSRYAGDSHKALERYAATPTWVLGVDGDELFDPEALGRLRNELLAGGHADVFRIKAHVLNCDRLDLSSRIAYGFMAPPSRPVTKLFNFGALESWTRCPERLHAGDVVYRPGFHWEVRRDLALDTDWHDDPLHCLHTCFLRRSSAERMADVGVRPNLDETGAFRRGLSGTIVRALRRPSQSPGAARAARLGSNWKREWYARGEHVSVDARPFLGSSLEGAHVSSDAGPPRLTP